MFTDSRFLFMPTRTGKETTGRLGRSANRLGTWPLVFLYPSRTPHGNGQTRPNHECLRKLWKLATLWIWRSTYFHWRIRPFSRVPDRRCSNDSHHRGTKNLTGHIRRSGFRVSFTHRQDNRSFHSRLLRRNPLGLQYQSRNHGNHPDGFSPLYLSPIRHVKNTVWHRA